MQIWMVWDRYHRVPLAPTPCRTLQAVFRHVASRIELYQQKPVCTPDGAWIEDTVCDSPRHTTCPHGVKRV